MILYEVLTKCALYVGYHDIVACLFRATANAVERYPRLRYERDANCHAYSGRFVTAFDLTYCSVLLGETIMALVYIFFHLDKTTGSPNDLSKRSVIERYFCYIFARKGKPATKTFTSFCTHPSMSRS